MFTILQVRKLICWVKKLALELDLRFSSKKVPHHVLHPNTPSSGIFRKCGQTTSPVHLGNILRMLGHQAEFHEFRPPFARPHPRQNASHPAVLYQFFPTFFFFSLHSIPINFIDPVCPATSHDHKCTQTPEIPVDSSFLYPTSAQAKPWGSEAIKHGLYDILEGWNSKESDTLSVLCGGFLSKVICPL